MNRAQDSFWSERTIVFLEGKEVRQECGEMEQLQKAFFFPSEQDLVLLLDQWECKLTRTGAEMLAGISVDAE